ncbi:MAG: DMT family transporter [Candidatus Eremiobacteraeota bacterium]|nr:DMT family transporter [Candidatus Eremiobacteraeota bacterium]
MPYIILGGAQIAVGAAAIFARWALGGADPLAVSALRLAIAAILLLLAALFMRAKMGARKPTRQENTILALAGFALATHFATWIWSLEYTTVAISTLLVCTTPIWTAIYDTLVLKRRLSRLAMIAFATGIAGMAMVVGFDKTAPPVTGHQLLGAGLALVGSVAIGAYFILVREVREALDTRAIVTRTYSWAALALVVAAAIAHQPPPPLAATTAWSGILAMALISQLLGHTALNAALRWFSPSAINFATLLEPVIAALLALAIFGEAVAPLSIVGGVILLVSIGVVLREDRLLPVQTEPAL